jgi:hypothetical protein
MNNKFLPGSVLFVIALVLINLAFLAKVKAVEPTDTFYRTGAGNNATGGFDDSASGYNALHSITGGGYDTASGDSAL